MLNIGKGDLVTWKAVGVYNKLTSRGSRYPHREHPHCLELWYPESNAGDKSEAATRLVRNQRVEQSRNGTGYPPDPD